jgi:hypothetical protein
MVDVEELDDDESDVQLAVEGNGTMLLVLLVDKIPPVAPVAAMIEAASASLVQETNCVGGRSELYLMHRG